MSELVKPVYTVQGHRFRLKPTTPKNRRLVTEILGHSIEEIMEKLPEISNAKSYSDVLRVFDETYTYFEVFCALTEGPHDKLEFDDFDQKVAEQVARDFFPPAQRTALEQIGFISTSPTAWAPEEAQARIGDLG